MTEKTWRALAEFVQRDEPGRDYAAAQNLDAAVHELDLPPPVRERLKSAVVGAVSRAFQGQAKEAAAWTVLLRVMVSETPQSAGASPCWGFFLVEKDDQAAARRTVEVFVYGDEG